MDDVKWFVRASPMKGGGLTDGIYGGLWSSEPSFSFLEKLASEGYTHVAVYRCEKVKELVT